MDITTMPWGPDVSHYRPVQDWKALAASGATFFGAKAKMPAGPAALAIDTGAVLITAALYLQDGQNHVRFYPPVEVPQDGERTRRIFRTTQLLAERYEESVAAYPTDWHMLQRIWLDDLEPRGEDA